MVNCNAKVSDYFINEVLDQLDLIRHKHVQCTSHQVCKSIKDLIWSFDLKKTLSIKLVEEGLSPFISDHNCDELFPECSLSYM